jgi:hypothetical protein
MPGEACMMEMVGFGGVGMMDGMGVEGVKFK